MRQAFMYLTLKCNNSCKMCYMNNHYSKKNEMDFNEACNTLRILKTQKIEKVTFLGGEPTLYTKLNELLQYAKDIGISFVRIQTNGQFNKAFFNDKLLMKNIDAFTFSLDGHTEELNGIMRIGSDFDAIISNIKLATTTDKKIAVNITVSVVNIDYVCEIIDFVYSLGVKKIYINLMFDANEVKMTQNEADEFQQKWKFTTEVIKEKYSQLPICIKLPIGFSYTANQNNKCEAFSPNRVYIMPNLDQFPCILMVNNPEYAITPYSWRFPTIMKKQKCLQCEQKCMFLVNTYKEVSPMCLYNKINIGKEYVD